jgi:hypothetical protein
MSAPDFQVTMPVAAYRNGIHDALLFAGTDDSLPILNGVWLKWDGAKLTATASDRYYIGRSTFPATVNEDGAAWQRFLPADRARVILGALKPYADIAILLRITVARGSIAMANEELTLTVPLGADTNDFGILDKLDHLLTAQPVPDGGSAAFSADRLARFAKVSREYEEPTRLRIAGATDPVVVQVGDHFDGLIMPVKINGTFAATAAKPAKKRVRSCGDCDGPCGDCDPEHVIEMQGGPNIVAHSAEERDAIQAAMKRNGEILRETEGGAA